MTSTTTTSTPTTTPSLPSATSSSAQATRAPRVTAPAPRPLARPTAAAARLEEGTKRIVVDVAPAVHKQVKVKAVEFSGGIKEYVLRLLEADGIDLSEQPDFTPRPTNTKARR